MTKITYDAENYTLEMDGHAGAGAPGQDIVCAAETILMRALVAAVMDEQSKLCPSVRQRSGYAKVQCSPTPRAKTMCKAMMQTIFTGYELLAQHYPEHVKVYTA